MDQPPFTAENLSSAIMHSFSEDALLSGAVSADATMVAVHNGGTPVEEYFDAVRAGRPVEDPETRETLVAVFVFEGNAAVARYAGSTPANVAEESVADFDAALTFIEKCMLARFGWKESRRPGYVSLEWS